MLEQIICKLAGHSETTNTEYQWDIPFNPSSVPDNCMKNGFASYKWYYCSRCNTFLYSETVPTVNAPSPIETAPLP